MNRRNMLKTSAVAAVASFTFLGAAYADNPVLKIGFVGVTSGPAAAWGTSNVRSMQTLAAMVNDAGGVKIGDKTYTRRHRHLRRPEGPQARDRRHGEDGAGRHSLRRRPERR